MLVTIAASGANSRKVPSLSSASTTSHSPSSHDAFVPTSLRSPPIRKLGCQPASRRISASIDDVVVFPWLPATATVRRSATIARCVSARLNTGTPSSLGAPDLGVRRGDGGRRDERIDAVGDVAGIVPDARVDAERAQALERAGVAQVGAADPVPHADRAPRRTRS